MGFCGVPLSLVERYAEELHLDVSEAAQCIENCRLRALQHCGRPGVSCLFFPPFDLWSRQFFYAHQVQNDRLGDFLHSSNYTVDTTSLPDFLVSLGLPMYLEKLITHDITTLPQLYQISTHQLQEAGIQNEAHLHRFLAAIEATKGRVTKKTPKGSASHVMTVSAKSRVVDRV